MITRSQITRRTALTRLTQLGLLAGAAEPWALRSFADEPAPEFKFIVVNDTHYLSDECGPFLAGLVRQMNTEGAALCLHAGDVTDKAEVTSMEAARSVFARLEVPFYCVPGNHDWVSPTDPGTYDRAFPQRRNYAFTHGGWQFVALDTTEGQKSDKTQVQPATLAALDQLLPTLDPQKPTVVLTHFPLCPGVKMRPLNADDLLARFQGWSVPAMFSGHFHGFTECTRDGATLTTNRCCARQRNNHDGTKEKGYFVCSVRAGQLTRAFVEYRGV